MRPRHQEERETKENEIQGVTLENLGQGENEIWSFGAEK